MTFDTRALLSFSTLADRAFARLWLKYSLSPSPAGSLPDHSFKPPDPTSYPITKYTQGPVFALNDSETVVPALVSLCNGVVLELGPGAGSQLPRFNPDRITRIYGVEPVSALHGALRAKVKETRLDDVYNIVPCGIQDTAKLETFGIVPGSVDTILSVQVLCSVEEPAKVLRYLYMLLKPGGRMVVYEHVKSEDRVSRIVQSECLLSFGRSCG